ncbi:hypothetical protein GCM10028833_10330 [Glycomyces tarimensis]
MAEHEATEIVEREGAFETLLGHGALRRLPVREEAQGIDNLVACGDLVDRPPCGFDTGQVRLDEVHPVGGVDPCRIGYEPPAFGGIAANGDDRIAAFGPGEGQRTPHPIGATADDDDMAVWRSRLRDMHMRLPQVVTFSAYYDSR